MFVTELVLLDLPKPDFWAVGADLVWQDKTERITVPKGFRTDLASIPVALRSLLDRNGVSRRPAVLHDFLYGSHVVSRRRADALLRQALLSEGESAFGAWVYWAGVRIGGAGPYAESPHGLTGAEFMTRAEYDAAMAARPWLVHVPARPSVPV